MKDKVNETAKDINNKKVYEQKEVIENNAEPPKQFDSDEISIIQRFSQFFKEIKYVRANKSLSSC
jgi:DNA-binding transcriptional regulator YiaG